ncbi:DpnII family type II restriction endonuclease [Chloroflexota bacterium]
MANLDFYKKHLNLSTVDEICKSLSDTLIETNYTYDFFVNWTKVINNRDAFKYELALLKSMKNSLDPVLDFHELLSKYPEVIKVIPILLACRDGLIKVLNSMETSLGYKTFNFSQITYGAKGIDDIVRFTKNTGLLDILCQMDSAIDYLLGVEVGLDTNARKNRSGLFLEKMVKETLNELSSRNHDLMFIEQKSFGYIEETTNISIPSTLRDRKLDYAVIYKGEATNIEVNFYGGTGSKPSEIVSSYINRGEVLSSTGWKFVWLTDGQGWKKMQSPFHIGIENMDYVINTNLLRKGFLEKIILLP